ncbi:MAG: 2-hydroxyacid dehydrogenase [Elusimicrobia bacterium]|nr:2-hydroxyacid dehydrogenase [Elusimicrobiota bacterium]
MIEIAVFDTKAYDRTALAAASADLRWRFLDFRLSVESASLARGAAAACVFVNDRLDRPCLKALVEAGVKMVAFRCAGFNNLDAAAAKELGLTVTRVPAYSPYAVAEHVVALLLALNRKIHRAYNRVREMNFSIAGLEGFDLNGKTAGIVGTGKIGRIAAKILKGFGMRVLAFDLYPDPAWAKSIGVEYADLRTVAKESDVVSLHLPLTPETKHIVRADTIKLMKPGAILINVSRGQLVDTTALIDALKSGQLGGVGLDVYEEEEGVFFEDLSGQILKDDELARLLTFPNVIITAHQAFLTREALGEIARVMVENIQAFSTGKPLLDGTVLVPGGNN